MELSTFLILLIFAIIFISIGFMINDTKYRIAYYMVVGLLCLCILNIYLSVVYYIQLRNDVGIIGPQGKKGLKGPKGPSGKCSFSEKCGIENPRRIILNTAEQMYGISKQCLDSPDIKNCQDQDTLEEANLISSQINMLEKIAYSTTMSQKDFEKKLKICLQDPNNCMDPTDF